MLRLSADPMLDMVVVVHDARNEVAPSPYHEWPVELRLFRISGGLGQQAHGLIRGQWLCLGPHSPDRYILNSDIQRLANIVEVFHAKRKYGWTS